MRQIDTPVKELIAFAVAARDGRVEATRSPGSSACSRSSPGSRSASRGTPSCAASGCSRCPRTRKRGPSRARGGRSRGRPAPRTRRRTSSRALSVDGDGARDVYSSDHFDFQGVPACRC
jgi:hypothetical protein